MKTFLKFFAASFLTLFLIGLISGVDDNEEIYAAVAIKNLSARQSSDAVLMAFQCEGRVTHLYDVEKNVLRRDPKAIAAVEPLPIIFKLKTHKELIITALGGSSGAVTVSTLTKINRRSGAAKQLAGVILGFASGYLAGYALTSRADSECSSPGVHSFVSKPESWKLLEHDFLVYRLYELGVRDPHWNGVKSQTPETSPTSISKNLDEQDRLGAKEYENYSLSPIIRCRTDIGNYVHDLTMRLDSGANPTRLDFEKLQEYERYLTRFKDDPTHDNLKGCIRYLADPERFRMADIFATNKGERGGADYCQSARISESQPDTPRHTRLIDEVLDRPYWFESSAAFQSACKRVFK